jgi:hypothetical protein
MKIRASQQPERSHEAPQNESTESKVGARGKDHRKLLKWGVLAVIAFAYLADLSPGHVFVADDFAAYVMHAANLAEGRPYLAINYVPNPGALWLAPSNGYPPIYPLILAPAYKIFGMNLRAFKAVTVICFVIFLAIFESLVRPMLSPAMSACALLILGFNSVFWDQRDYILSEFPYLMFSFGALLAIQNTYQKLTPEKLDIGAAMLLSVLLYCSYGTRTIGIALLAALVLADLAKFRRPSRFMVVVAAGTAILILAQTLFITSPKGYVSAFHFSLRTTLVNAVYYAKTLSYVWQNGFSKKLQIIFALLFTALAGFSFARHFWKERATREIYLLGYVGILFVWNAEIGLRGLLPILPLYIAYGVEEFGRIIEPLSIPTRRTATMVLLLFCGLTYIGQIRKESSQQAEPNVHDASAQELFSFLRASTQPSEVLIFPKPRCLALFTNRAVASFAPDEAPEDSADFMRSIHATILVNTNWSPPAWRSFLEGNKGSLIEIFHNAEYEVFRFDWKMAGPKGATDRGELQSGPRDQVERAKNGN